MAVVFTFSGPRRLNAEQCIAALVLRFNARMTAAEMIVWDTAVEQALRALDAKLGRATCDALSVLKT